MIGSNLSTSNVSESNCYKSCNTAACESVNYFDGKCYLKSKPTIPNNFINVCGANYWMSKTSEAEMNQLINTHESTYNYMNTHAENKNYQFVGYESKTPNVAYIPSYKSTCKTTASPYTLASCASTCVNTPGCESIVFDSKTNTCNLKKVKGKQTTGSSNSYIYYDGVNKST